MPNMHGLCPQARCLLLFINRARIPSGVQGIAEYVLEPDQAWLLDRVLAPTLKSFLSRSGRLRGAAFA